jgi:macrodomain Ter protein organizer (MatP/YcbG family)
MGKEELKSISVEVSKDVWKKLKILCIQEEVSLPDKVKTILERAVHKKHFETIEES